MGAGVTSVDVEREGRLTTTRKLKVFGTATGFHDACCCTEQEGSTRGMEREKGAFCHSLPSALVAKTAGLTVFLDDGRIELDSNTVERSIRPLALNRKNALFAGSDEGGDNWPVIATLIENCKITGINPHAWMTSTLTTLANGHPANSVGELMPWIAVA